MSIASLALLLVIAQAPVAQEARTGTGLIVGQVVDAGSGAPVAGAIAELGGLPGANVNVRGADMLREPPGSRRALTGRDGRFVFFDLPAGQFSVTVVKSGYTEGAFGQRRPRGSSRQIPLTQGQRLGDVVIRLWKQGVITGRVVDETGEGVVGVNIRAFSRRGQVDRRFATAATAITDDRGSYRIARLDAGEYIVGITPLNASLPVSFVAEGRPPPVLYVGGMAPPSSGRSMVLGDQAYAIAAGSPIPAPVRGRISIYPATFYPSSPDPATAGAIRLAPGEERDGVDLNLTPAPSVSVSGIVTGAPNPGGLAVRLIPPVAAELANDAELPTTMTDRNGTFTFPAVVPGDYTLLTTSRSRLREEMQSAAPEALFAEVPLTVGQTDLTGLQIALRAALRITGRFEFEGASERPQDLSRMQVSIERLGSFDRSTSPVSQARATGSGFSSAGLSSGRYYVRVANSPPGWMFKSATLAGRDVADTPLDLRDSDVTDVVVTFSDKWSGLNGTVFTPAGSPDHQALVIVFPTDPATWASAGWNPRRVRAARTSATGQYVFRTLPPGDYHVAAVPEDLGDDWRNPSVLERLASSAQAVTIRDGERPALDLRSQAIR